MSHLAPFGLIKIFRSFQDAVSRWYKSARGWGRLATLLAAAVFLSFWVASGQVDAETLFQSPQSPADQPPVEQPPVEQAPAEVPVEQPPVEQAPAEVPVEQPPIEQSPIQSPVEQAPAPQSPVMQPPADPAAPAPPTLESTRHEREEVPPDEAGGGGPVQFILDQAELIDTMVVSGAYIWLCCGVSLFLLVPLFLLFVYIRGRSKIIREEGY